MAAKSLDNSAVSGNADPVAVESLPGIVYKGVPVITTEHMGQAYGVPAQRIRENFSANQDRFVTGRHFFKLENGELKDFRDCIGISDAVIPPRTRNLLLWTARGAARHAKMLNTDTAWDVFEKLEDSYFSKAPAQADSPAPAQKALPAPVGKTVSFTLDELENELRAMLPYFESCDALIALQTKEYRLYDNERGVHSLAVNVQKLQKKFHKKFAELCAALRTLPASTHKIVDPRLSQIARQNALWGWEKRRKQGHFAGPAEGLKAKPGKKG